LRCRPDPAIRAAFFGMRHGVSRHRYASAEPMVPRGSATLRLNRWCLAASLRFGTLPDGLRHGTSRCVHLRPVAYSWRRTFRGGEEANVAQNDAWRAYVELALGLTDTSRKKAMKIVQQVAGKGGATAEQLQELVNQGMANREAMTRMIRVELDRALGRVGLATMDEVEELNRRVRDLERELYATRVAAGMTTAAEPAVDGVAPAPPAAHK